MSPEPTSIRYIRKHTERKGNQMTTQTQTSELKEAFKELFSPTEWKETLTHIHNDAEAVRHLSLFGYGISFALGGLVSIILIANFG
jgi:hypothetical protein